MRRPLKLLLPLAAVCAMLAALIAAPPAYSADPVRIMPLGDSITGSPGCWRALLWNQLQDGGYLDVDFVGTLGPQGCGVPYDGENEGHGGALVTNVANQNQLPAWLSATSPDVVMMHFGTNDVWSNRATSEILSAYTTLVNQMRAQNPSMAVLVAQIIPMSPDVCGACSQRVVDLNAAIPSWAAGLSTAQSPITVVDQWTGFSTAADTYDGIHPNASGDQKLADGWYPALTSLLDGVTPPPTSPLPPTSPPPPPPTSPPPPPAGGCTAAYQIIGQWQGGFQGEVTVTNTSAAAISGWTVEFTFADGQQVTQSWQGQLAQQGATVTVQNETWNGGLAPAASTSFGFLASWNQTNSMPSPICTPA